MWFFRYHLLYSRWSCLAPSRSGLRWTAWLIISSLSAIAGAVPVATQQEQEDQSSSSQEYAELLTTEPQDPEAQWQTIEQQLRRNAEIYQPCMTRIAFASLCYKVDLNAEQLVSTDYAFDKYEQRLQKLHERHMDHVVPAILEYMQISQEEADAEDGLAGELVVAIGKTIERHRKRNNELLQALHKEVQAHLEEGQLKTYDSGLQAWRRSFMLNPGESDRRDANLGRHIDVFEAIEEVCQRYPALAGLLDSDIQPPANDDLARARRECQDFLEVCELELDTLIRRRFWKTWQRTLRLQRASAVSDQDAVERIRHQHLRDWLKIYRFNAKVAERLADSIEAYYGVKLASQWRDFYYAAYFPRLYEEESSDLLYHWFTQQTSIEDDLRQVGEAIYNEYLESMRALRFRTRSALINLVAHSDLNPRMLELNASNGNTPIQIIKLDEERDALNHRTTAQFRAILPEDKRAGLDAVILTLERAHSDRRRHRY